MILQKNDVERKRKRKGRLLSALLILSLTLPDLYPVTADDFMNDTQNSTDYMENSADYVQSDTESYTGYDEERGAETGDFFENPESAAAEPDATDAGLTISPGAGTAEVSEPEPVQQTAPDLGEADHFVTSAFENLSEYQELSLADEVHRIRALIPETEKLPVDAMLIERDGIPEEREKLDIQRDGSYRNLVMEKLLAATGISREETVFSQAHDLVLTDLSKKIRKKPDCPVVLEISLYDEAVMSEEQKQTYLPKRDELIRALHLENAHVIRLIDSAEESQALADPNNNGQLPASWQVKEDPVYGRLVYENLDISIENGSIRFRENRLSPFALILPQTSETLQEGIDDFANGENASIVNHDLANETEDEESDTALPEEGMVEQENGAEDSEDAVFDEAVHESETDDLEIEKSEEEAAQENEDAASEEEAAQENEDAASEEEAAQENEDTVSEEEAVQENEDTASEEETNEDAAAYEETEEAQEEDTASDTEEAEHTAEEFEETPEENADIAVGDQQLTSGGDTYEVSVSYDETANIPEGSELVVNEYSENSVEYDLFSAQAVNVLEGDAENILSIKIMDVTIENDGKAIEPEVPVDVTVQLENTQDNQAIENQVVLIAQQAEVMEAVDEENESSSTYTTTDQSMDSIYAIITRSLTKELISSDGNAYEVTVTYDSNAQIPVGTELQVQEIPEDSPEYESYLNQTAETLEKDARSISYARLLDISLIKDGEEIEIGAPVAVRIQLKDKDPSADAEELSVVHFADEPELMASETESGEEGEVIRFETGSFSVYAVVYTVDFHWGEYTYNLQGGSEIFLSELLNILAENSGENAQEGEGGEDFPGGDVEESDSTRAQGGSAEVYSSTKLREIAADIDLVENVEFSNPELIDVQKVQVLPAMEEMDEEDDESLLAMLKNDWRLTSLEPFDTDEILTITLTDGEKIEIHVTDERVAGAATSNRTRVTVDGVTYTLTTGGIQGGRTTSAADGTAYYGKATVSAISAGCTIHDEITYGGKLYKVWNIAASSDNLTKIGAKMDRELVNRASGYKFTLPKVKTDITQTEKDDLAAQGFTFGKNNEATTDENGNPVPASDNKLWKKATYDPATNSIKYEIKTFQAMKEDVPLDFIFIYDDSITMYTGDRGAPVNNAGNNYNETVIREAQGTRLLILSAAQALMGATTADGYNIRMAMGGASDGDKRISSWYTMGDTGYSGVESYLAKYATGVTSHATGTGNALTLARQSLNAKRQPIVIYLSDFIDGGSVRSFQATANQLKSVASVYCLSTRNSRTYPRLEAIASRADSAGYRSPYIHTMSEISDGVQALETIILDAIGYYMKDKVDITDNLSDALADKTPGIAALDSFSYYAEGSQQTGTAGSANQQSGKSIWSIGGSGPYPGAGTIYTEEFTVQLDDDTVYAGAMPTNGTTSLTRGGKETNTLEPDESDPDHLHMGGSVTFVLGRTDEKYTSVTTGNKGEPANKVNGISFTLTEAEKDVDKSTDTLTIYKSSGGASHTYTTATVNLVDGVFVIPFKESGSVVLELGKTYLLTENGTSVDTYNSTRTASNMADPQLVKPDKEWVVHVGTNGVVTVTVNGVGSRTPDASKWKGTPPKFVLWNQIVVPAKLIPITVQKTWPDNDHPHDPVPFTVYGVNRADGERYPLFAYDSNGESPNPVNYIAEGNPEFVESTDGKVWSQTVYVLDKMDVNGTTVEFYTYTNYLDLDNLTPEHTYEVGTTALTAEEWTKLDALDGETDRKVSYGQNYSYDIEEGNLVYPDGWYTPGYSNNASERAADGYMNQTETYKDINESWTTTTPEKKGYKMYDDNDDGTEDSTATTFQLHFNAMNFAFNDYDSVNDAKHKEYNRLFGNGDGHLVSNNNEAKAFYKAIDTVIITIQNSNNSNDIFRLTFKPGAYDDPDVGNGTFHADHGVLFKGLKLPAEWANYTTSGTERSIDGLTITSMVIIPKGDPNYRLQVYGGGTSNSLPYHPTYHNTNAHPYHERRLEIETYGTQHDNKHNWATVSGTQTLEKYYNIGEQNIPGGTAYTVNIARLNINNAWEPNTLLPLLITKDWAVNDGEASHLAAAIAAQEVTEASDPDYGKNRITFSLRGSTPSGGEKDISIFSGAADAWSTGVYTGKLTSDDAVSSAKWEKIVYVPTFDTSTYDRSKDPVCEAYTYSNNDLTENALIVGTDEDGAQSGEWTTTTVKGEHTQTSTIDGTENKWHTLTDLSGSTNFYFNPGSTLSNIKKIVLDFEYAASQSDQYDREYVMTLTLPSAATFTPQANYPHLISFPGLSQLYNQSVTMKSIVFTNSSGTEIPVTFTKHTGSGTASFPQNAFKMTRTTSQATSGYSTSKWVDDPEIKWCELGTPDSTVATKYPAFTITNTFTPNMALTLESDFTDESNDRLSTGDIGSVVYTIEGTTNSGAAYSRTVTTTASPATDGSNADMVKRSFSKTVYVPKGSYTVTETAYTVGGTQCAPIAYSVTNTVGGDTQNGSARSGYTLSSNDTITFDNVRKVLPVKVLIDWEPTLQTGEDPLVASGKALAYTISYEDSHRELQELSGDDYKLTAACEQKDYTGIPTYSVLGLYTECTLNNANMAETLPEYNLYVIPEEKEISGTISLVFTIEAHIKRAGLVVEKHFDEAFQFNQYKGATLTYTIKRSDNANIYGTGTNTVMMTIQVPSDTQPKSLNGEFLLNGGGVTAYYTGLDAKTKEAFSSDDMINLPILRSTDVDGDGKRVKYVLSEEVSGVTLKEYFPNFTDQTGNSYLVLRENTIGEQEAVLDRETIDGDTVIATFDNAFEQTNPPGKNVDTATFGEANKAKFILNPAGIVVDVDNADAPYICKIVEDFGSGVTEVPFRTLNAAVNYARENITMDSTHPVTIQMLVDYDIPSTDVVSLGKGTVTVDGTSIAYTDNIIITTAATTGGIYNYTNTKSDKASADKDIAIITRKTGNTYRFFKVTDKDASLSFEKIILDGDYTGTAPHTLNGGFIEIKKGEVNLKDKATLRNSYAASGGAVYIMDTVTSGDEGTLNMYSGAEIKNCSAVNGGAVYMKATTYGKYSFNMHNGSIKDCYASTHAGAVYAFATVSGSSDFTMGNGTIDGCHAGGNGGAVYVYNNGTFTLNDGTVKNCYTGTNGTTLDGGAVFLELDGASFTMNGGTIEGCKANNGGVVGSVCAGSLTKPIMFTMNGGTIKKCTANTLGGAANVHNYMHFDMTGGTITECKAGTGGAVYLLAAGSQFNMSGGTIEKCEAETSGAVHIADAGTMTMSGGSIKDNKTTRTNTLTTEAGAGVGAIEIASCGAIIELKGNPVIYGNLDKDSKQANIRLNHDATQTSQQVIRVVETGLTTGAKIGVWPTYANNQDDGEQFAITVADTAANSNLSGFLNDYHSDHASIKRALSGWYETEGSAGKVIWRAAICKIVETSGEGKGNENIFPTLNQAVTFARTKGNGSAMNADNAVKIEMLVDYAIPADDKVELNKTTDNITLTTASTTKGEYKFVTTFNTGTAAGDRLAGDSTEKSILRRKTGFNNASLFSVSNSAKLNIASLILDGADIDCSTIEGGLVNVNGGKLYVNANSFMRNSKAKNGGAIYATTNTKAAENTYDVEFGALTITDCYATGTGSNGNGGAICLGGLVTAKESGLLIDGHSSAEIHTDDTENLNDAKAATTNAVKGGGIYVGAGSEFIFSGGGLTKCKASEKGGAIYNAGTVRMVESSADTSNLKRGTIEHCSAITTTTVTDSTTGNQTITVTSGEGGGIYVDGTGTLTMTGGAIEYCTAYNGGGIYNNSSALMTQKADGTYEGGAVDLSDDTEHPGIIDHCSAFNNGGGIYVAAGELDMTGGHIEDCYATENGGGVYDNTSGRMIISGVTIIGHKDLPSGTLNARKGGAIYVADGHMEIKNSFIYNFTAEQGGAIYHIYDAHTKLRANEGKDLIISNVTIDGHREIDGKKLLDNTPNATKGGAVYIYNGCNSELEDHKGHATAITQRPGPKLVIEDDSKIYDCTATKEGGAVYCDSPANTNYYSVTIRNTTIDGHQSLPKNVKNAGTSTSSVNNNPGFGGAIYQHRGYLLIGGDTTTDAVTIKNCTADEGGAVYNMGNAKNMQEEQNASEEDPSAPDDLYNRLHTILIKNTTINGHDGLDSGTPNATNGGAIFIKMGTLILESSRIQNNSATNGGAIYARTNNSGTNVATVYMDTVSKPNTIIGNSATAAGAGIYLFHAGAGKSGAVLNIAGNNNFGGDDLKGGSGTDKDDIKGTDGNFVIKTSYGNKKNGGKAYPEVSPATNPKTYKVRQDIFIAETATDPASIILTGNVTSGAGSVWVWAEHVNHYEMLKPFATHGTTTINDATYKAFRNAQADDMTGCGAEYLTGQTGENEAFLYWTGGFDFAFLKVDGNGDPLDGATFTLYKANDDGTDILTNSNITTGDNRVAYQQTVNGTKQNATATSGEKKNTSDTTRQATIKYKGSSDTTASEVTFSSEHGLVVFEKIPPATYFLVETTKPKIRAKKTEETDAQYAAVPEYETLQEKYKLVIAGDGTFTISHEDGKDSSNNVKWTEEITKNFTGKDKNNADKAVDVYTVMNVSSLSRKVILRKVEKDTYTSLKDAKFTIYYADKQNVVGIKHTTTTGTGESAVTTTTTEELKDLTSLDSGVFWIGQLPFGTYYMAETATPIRKVKTKTTVTDEHGMQVEQETETTITYTKPTHYFVFRVDENGVSQYVETTENGATTGSWPRTNELTASTKDADTIPTSSSVGTQTTP